MRSSRFPYLVLAPMIALMLVFLVIPIVANVVISFMDYNPLRAEGNQFIGLSNYARFFEDDLFAISFKNTLVYVFASTAINLCLTLLIAQLLANLRSSHWRSFFRVGFFMPCVAPLAAMSVVWQRSILSLKGGLLNMGLALFGVSAINWMDAKNLMASIVILTLWADMGYNVVLFTSGIEGIPASFYEAAEIDGAGPIRKFFSLTFPLLNRTFAFVSITTMISYFESFAQFSIIAKDGGAGRAGYVLSTYIYDMGFGHKDMGYAAAISMALFAVIMVITLIQRRLTKVDWGY